MITLLMAAAVCLPVNGDRITAGELARVAPAFSSLPPDTPVSFAPAPGAHRQFHPAELGRLAARHGVKLDAPAEACFERNTTTLAREDMLAAMSRALPGASVEIVECSRYTVPAGEVEFPITGLTAPPREDTPALWRGAVRYAGGRRAPVWARVRISAPVSRVIAAEPLPAGKPIASSQVRHEVTNAFPQQGTSLEQVVGRIPRRGIAAGAVISPRQLAPAPEVARGDAVKVEVREGNARLELEALAERGGARGDRIPVRNSASGRSFTARVAGPGKVVVEK